MEGGKKILIIDFCNFEDYPIGGHLTFAKNLMLSFENQLFLVGITTNPSDPLGKWFKKKIDNQIYDFFALAKYNKSVTKHVVPDRLVSFLLLRFYKKKILRIQPTNIFIQRSDILIAVKNFDFKNICYRFAGVENPLKISKYWYGHFLSKIYDKIFFNSFRKVSTILASSDQDNINKMISRSYGKVPADKVFKFPTRIDTSIFKPIDKIQARNLLQLPNLSTIIVTTGRLAWFKGWKFMIDCFEQFQTQTKECFFYFIGEGEDLEKISEYISQKKLENKIKLLGKKDRNEISLFLNASDLFIMASYKEGWSTTLVEALSCGVPICCTNFSSANDIITEGVSGYVAQKHDIKSFTEQMQKAILLNRNKLPEQNEIRKYAITDLKTDLLKHWKLI
jgi:glycosyltransferase involved in cell wall biosynthesis